MKERVVISANTCWYLYNFRQNTIRALLSEGVEVFCVAPEDGYSAKLEAIGASWFDISIDQSGVNPLVDMITLWQFYRCFRKLTPKVVLNFTPKNNIYSTLAASLLGIPCINNIAGLGSVFIEDSIVSKITRLLYRVSQRKAAMVFFQNEEDREVLVQCGAVKMERTERLFGSGIDLSRFSVAPRAYDGRTRFLLVARLLKQKGVYEYAEAAKRLKARYGQAVEFWLLGFLDESNPSSVNRTDLESWCNDGFISYRGVTDAVEFEIAEVDCVVLPSFYREGVPRSLLEGLASGKPIVTTDNVGCRETVVDGQNGYLVEVKNVSSLEGALAAVINLSQEQRLAFGLSSRVLAESTFDERVVIDRYLSVINEVI